MGILHQLQGIGAALKLVASESVSVSVIAVIALHVSCIKL